MGKFCGGRCLQLPTAEDWYNRGFRRTNVVEVLCYCAYAVAIGIGFGFPPFWPDGIPAGSTSACDPSDTHAINVSMCGTIDVFISEMGELRTLVSFILGGFVSASVNMYVVRTTNYTSLCGAVRIVSVQIASIVSRLGLKGDGDPYLCALAETMARWNLLGFEASLLKARGRDTREEGREHLEELGLLVGDEWALMQEAPGEGHNIVWNWISIAVQELVDKKYVEPCIANNMNESIRQVRANANDLMSPISRDLPFSYVVVCGYLVNVNIIVYATGNGLKWARWFYETSGRIWLTPVLYFDLLLLFLYALFFTLLYDVGHSFYNPFGPRYTDIPHGLVAASIQNLTRTMLVGRNPISLDAAKDLYLHDDGGNCHSTIHTEDDVSRQRRRPGEETTTTFPPPPPQPPRPPATVGKGLVSSILSGFSQDSSRLGSEN